MLCTSAGPDHVLQAGTVYDLPRELAQQMLKATNAASMPGREIPAAELVTDPRERAKAVKYVPPAAHDADFGDDDTTWMGGRE